MKNYTIFRNVRVGNIQLVAEDNAAGEKRNQYIKQDIVGKFSIGDASDGTLALARAIMDHYFDGAAENDIHGLGLTPAKALMEAFLIHHAMPRGSQYVISGDVLDNFFRKVETIA